MKAYVFAAEAAHLLHLLFEWFAIATGVQVYRWQRARRASSGILQRGEFGVVIGCILGAAAGNKLVFWLEFPQLWSTSLQAFDVLMSGQSIVGGLLGGLLGVELAKKLIGVTRSTGDDFVLPLVVSTAVGRIGCYLAGLQDGTYGVPTTLPWGVDFGDGFARHPTQVYDMLFVVGWGSLLLSMRKDYLAFAPGLTFKLYLAGYLCWRLAVDAIKPIPYGYWLGLSGIQWTCLVALLVYLPFIVNQFQKAQPDAVNT